jgi:hypothetical protein
MEPGDKINGKEQSSRSVRSKRDNGSRSRTYFFFDPVSMDINAQNHRIIHTFLLPTPPIDQQHDTWQLLDIPLNWWCMVKIMPQSALIKTRVGEKYNEKEIQTNGTENE